MTRHKLYIRASRFPSIRASRARSHEPGDFKNIGYYLLLWCVQRLIIGVPNGSVFLIPLWVPRRRAGRRLSILSFNVGGRLRRVGAYHEAT